MENEKTEKQCLHCGEMFFGIEDQKYCSTSCRVMAYRKRKDNQENVSEDEPEINSEDDPELNEDIDLSFSEEDALKYKDSKVLDTILINDIPVEILEGKRIRFTNRNDRPSVISIYDYNKMIQRWQNLITYYAELLTDQFARGKRSTIDSMSIVKKAMDLMDNFGMENNQIMPYIFGSHPFHFYDKITRCIVKDENGLNYSPSPDSTEVIARILQYIIGEGYFQKLKL